MVPVFGMNVKRIKNVWLLFKTGVTKTKLNKPTFHIKKGLFRRVLGPKRATDMSS